MESFQRCIVFLDIMKTSSKQTPLSRTEIAEAMEKEGIAVSSKTISRYLSALKIMGYDVLKVNQKFYIQTQDASIAEKKMMIDMVHESMYFSREEKQDFTGRIQKTLASRYHETFLYDEYFSAYEVSVMDHIEVMMEAIALQKKIKITYQKNPFFESKERVATIYCLRKNRGYNAIINFDKYDALSNLTLQKVQKAEIIDVPAKPLELIFPVNSRFEMEKWIRQNIYNYSGRPLYIEMWINKKNYEYALFEFSEVNVMEEKEEYVRINVRATQSEGLYYWLLQHNQKIKVIRPESVREKLLEYAQGIIDLYQNE